MVRSWQYGLSCMHAEFLNFSKSIEAVELKLKKREGVVEVNRVRG